MYNKITIADTYMAPHLDEEPKIDQKPVGDSQNTAVKLEKMQSILERAFELTAKNKLTPGEDRELKRINRVILKGSTAENNKLLHGKQKHGLFSYADKAEKKPVNATEQHKIKS